MEAIGAGQQKKHFLKNGQPQQALNTLLDAAARLRAEIRWFPGCAPEAAKALVQFANAAKERLPANASSLPAIGVFNALCYTLPRRRVKNIQNLEESFNDLGKYQRLVTAQEVFRLINGDRRIAKFPVVPHQAEVERELAALLAHAKALAVGAVERRSGKEQKALDALLDESAIVSRLEITSMRLKALTLAAAQASAPPDQDKLP